MQDFPFDGNSSVSCVCSIYYHLQNIRNRNMHYLDIDIQIRSWLNASMKIKSQYRTFYLIEIVIFALSIIVYEILAVEMCMTLTWTFRMGKDKCKYTNRTPTGNFLCIDNSNVCSMCHRLLDIHRRNQHHFDLDLDLQNGPRSNVNITIESQ